VLEGARILARSGRVQAIAFYMVLLGVLATAFHVAETDWLGELRKRDQHTWLADVEFWGQSFVLGLQLLCTGRLLQRWPGSALLVSLPIVSIVGLGALWLVPRLDTLNLVQIGRRGAQYAFEKPAREVLYTPLALATKHKVKFLLDTFAFRLGDLLGVLLQVQMMRWGWTRNPVVLVTIAVALVWIGLGLWLGRRRNVADAA
jgi:AAA family ATP:ADP antiporter